MKENFLGKGSQTIIGMVHCLPLPGTYGFDGDYNKIIEQAVQDAITLEKAGVDAVIVENMGDTPFSALLDKLQVAALTTAAVVLTGVLGSVIGPALCKLFRLKDDISRGVALGTASHVVGTSKANEVSPLVGAVSSLSLVVSGLLTAILFPVLTAFL